MSELTSPSTPNDLPGPLAGRELGGYALLRKIGTGGMADVYLAQQKSLGRQVALKVLHAHLASDPNYVRRFHNEARAAASLVHPNIVQIYEVGQDQGIHYIAQEFIAGKSLDHVLERQGALEPGTVLEILRQVVSALCKAAEIGIVHRDIKPANIMFSPAGEVKVADFGLARIEGGGGGKTLTQVGVAMGTPLYMSPEQIEGRPVDVRSDLYSLGATTYHLLAGQPPHNGETALAIAVQHLNKQPPELSAIRAGLAPEFVTLVHRLLEKEPAQRYASPNTLLSDLKSLASQAAQEGWAVGPDQWSLVEWLSADNSRGAAHTELGQLMHQRSQLELPAWNRKALALAMLAAVGLGSALGLAWQPRYFLQGTAPPASIPRRDSPAAQLFHAKLNEGSEAAWRAVSEYFPDADPFYLQLAQQGMVRFFLFDSQEFSKALPIAQELADQSAQNESLHSFALAAECICHERLGNHRAARDLYAKLTATLKDELNRSESQLYDLLESSVRHLGD